MNSSASLASPVRWILVNTQSANYFPSLVISILSVVRLIDVESANYLPREELMNVQCMNDFTVLIFLVAYFFFSSIRI